MWLYLLFDGKPEPLRHRPPLLVIDSPAFLLHQMSQLTRKLRVNQLATGRLDQLVGCTTRFGLLSLLLRGFAKFGALFRTYAKQ